MKYLNYIGLLFSLFIFQSFAQSYVSFEKDGLAGVKDDKGKVIIPATFSAIGKVFRNEIIPVKDKTGKWGFFKNSEKLYDCQYDNFRFTSVGTIIAQKNSRWGVINLEGKELAAFKYKYINHIDSYRYKAGRYNQWKLRNFDDEILQSYELDSLFYLGDNVFKFCQVGIYGLMDPKGNVITTENTDLFISLNPGRNIPALKKTVKEEKLSTFKPKLLKYEKLFEFKEGFGRYYVDGKYGFIDSSEGIRLVPQYEQARDFSNSMAAIMLRGKWGFMDTMERLKVQPYYDFVTDFQQGVAMVKDDLNFNFVNKEGKYLYGTHFELIKPTPYGRYILKKNGKYGLAAGDGHELVSTKYEAIDELENGYILAKEHGLWGVLNTKGNIVMSFNYSCMQYEWDHKLLLTMEPGGEITLDLK